MTPRNPTEGLTRAERTALCDSTYGLLARIGDHYQRQTTRPEFTHAPATIAALAERGLVEIFDDDFVQPTFRGRTCASRLRQRHAIIKEWETAEARRLGGRRGGRGKLKCAI